MNLTAPQKNALQGLDMLLRLSKVRVTRATLRDKLWQHPGFPNLASLSDTLDELKVDNLAAYLTPDQLLEISLPALVYLGSEGGFFAPLRATSADAVEWWHSKRGWQKETLFQFSQKWEGVTLLIESTEQSGEVDYAQSRKKELIENLRLPFVALSLLVCSGVWASGHSGATAGAPLYYASLLLLKLTGLLVSGLLVWYGLDEDNPFLHSIYQFNARTNCSTVLNTTAAKLFSWLSWAEVGLFYFGGGLLALLFLQKNTVTLYPLLLGLTITALPYTLWSVYYQWHRARQWCVLCLTVQVLLWLEFGVLFYLQRRLSWPKSFGGHEIGLLAASFLLLPALWALLKPVWNKALRTDGLKQNLQKIKFDPSYLKLLSQRARMLPPIFTGMQVPTLGNADAPHTLIVVTNPTCSLCVRIYLEIEQLMAEMEDICCQFIVAVERQSGNVGFAVAQHVLSQPSEKMQIAMHEWYTMLHLKSWLKKTMATQVTSEETGRKQLELHLRWCELAGINTMPTIFFNGIEMPQYYAISEFKILIKLLKEGSATMA